jgi:subtilisin family serine protease
MRSVPVLACFLVLLPLAVAAQEDRPDTTRDILVTFDNSGASIITSGIRAPYRSRKRYAIGADARRNAADVASEYSLTEVDQWPIGSLNVYCFVYRVPEKSNRNELVEKLRADPRIESVQLLQNFNTGTQALQGYDDTYAELQHGLHSLDIGSAHRYSRGAGVRVAIVDSYADTKHEDLIGRVDKVRMFAGGKDAANAAHGTAVASIIGANANNAKGIVGVAPESILEVFVSCWAEPGRANAVCDSFTLAQALDDLLDDPPDVLNMSLIGPHDPLLSRLLDKVHVAGVVVVAAAASDRHVGNGFPASLRNVIGVGTSENRTGTIANDDIFAPGMQVMVAVPDDAYDFRSGSSLAAAHVSGVVALLLSSSPDMKTESVSSVLYQSQLETGAVNACSALQLSGASVQCR